MNIPTTTPKQEREYLHTVSAGAVLPFLQATGFAVVIFIAVYVIAAVVFNAMDPHKSAAFFAALAWVWMIWRLIKHWLYLTTPMIETIVQRDINGDGVIGQPQATTNDEPRAVRVVNIRLDQVTSDKHYKSDMINFSCDDEQLYQLAFGLTNEPPLTFAERYWTGAGKPFSTNEFRAVVSEMEKHGLCEYVNAQEPKQGRRLTESGRKLFQEIALPHSPTTEGEA